MGLSSNTPLELGEVVFKIYSNWVTIESKEVVALVLILSMVTGEAFIRNKRNAKHMDFGHKEELFPKHENYAGVLRITNPKTLQQWKDDGRYQQLIDEGYIYAPGCGRFRREKCTCSACRRKIKFQTLN